MDYFIFINGFCESFYSDTNGEVISVELERAIRSITDLRKVIKKSKDSSGKVISQTIDTAKVMSLEMSIDEMKEHAFNNARLDNRKYTQEESRIFCPKSASPKSWLKENFNRVNKADLKELSLPKKIYIYVDDDAFGSSSLNKFDCIIDTKGIDENPIRHDLSDYIEREDTICLFTSSYNDAPEANVRELMKFFLCQSSKKYEDRFATLILPQNEEPEKENDGDGSRDMGISIKKKIVKGVFDSLNLKFNDENILFYDALQFFDSKSRIERDYDIEDIEDSKAQVISNISAIIENRKILLKNEITDIKDSSQLITEGKTLSEEEIESLNNAIGKIKKIGNLENRVPSYSYEEFIEKYIEYYSERYAAWNTKDAIHRRLGTFEERGFDTYFDATVVAEGLDDTEMVRKFTKDLKEEIRSILLGIGETLEILNPLIPEIITNFESQYDNFVKNVGISLGRYLLVNNENAEFWQELINRRGKGAGYNNDVCTIFMRKLDLLNEGVSINRVLQEFTEKEWKKMVNNVLIFFMSE